VVSSFSGSAVGRYTADSRLKKKNSEILIIGSSRALSPEGEICLVKKEAAGKVGNDNRFPGKGEKKKRP